MGTLNYIAYAVFAIIFIGIAFTIYAHYQQGAAEQDFLNNAQNLSNQIKNLALQDIGSSTPFSIKIPGGCNLSFENGSVLATVSGHTENFYTGVVENVVPSWSTSLSGERTYYFELSRVQEGVNVSVLQ